MKLTMGIVGVSRKTSENFLGTNDFELKGSLSNINVRKSLFKWNFKMNFNFMRKIVTFYVLSTVKITSAKLKGLEKN